MAGILGSAKWSTSAGYARQFAQSGNGFFLGHPIRVDNFHPITENFVYFPADGHFLAVAQTGSGKGTSLIINNLLCYRGNALVVDPKGEAWITAPRRRALGQNVHIVDPWDEVNSAYGSRVGVREKTSRFNPLSVLKPGTPDYVDQLAYLAEALIVTQGTKDPFWDDTARELVAGLMAYVVEKPETKAKASLGLVRSLLMEPANVISAIIEMASEFPAGSMAARKLGQFDNPEQAKQLASIIQSARTQTSFLDSPILNDSMDSTDFSFDDLRDGGPPTTVYLVLPVKYLDTHARWLRLMISIAIGAVQEGRLETPARPTAGGEESFIGASTLPTLAPPKSIDEWIKSVQPKGSAPIVPDVVVRQPGLIDRIKSRFRRSKHRPPPLKELPPAGVPSGGGGAAPKAPAGQEARLPVLFLLDEFGTIGKLSCIERAFGLLRGRGVCVFAFLQDLNQLKRDYGEAWQSFIGNSTAVISFGSMDDFTCEYISKMTGTKTVEYSTTTRTSSTSMKPRPPNVGDLILRNTNFEEPAGTSVSETTQQHVVAQPLLMADGVRRLHKDLCLVISRDKVALCARVKYFVDPIFSQWARRDPTH
jgi:type IV secretory pathway TraG/TraD family ATPase VirD4